MEKFYFGVCVKEDLDLVKELTRLRRDKNDVGVLCNAYYYKTKAATRKIINVCKNELQIDVIGDNGQIQSYRQGVLFPQEKLVDVIQEVNPKFTFAPDVIGSPQESLTSLCQFINKHNDLDLAAPLQAHNNGLLFAEKIVEEIDILKENGYERFGVGKPYKLKFTRRETGSQIIPRVRPNVKYLHFLGCPLGRGISGLNLCESADVGTFPIMSLYGVGIYKNPVEGAKLLSSLMDVDKAVSDLHDKKLQPTPKMETEGCRNCLVKT